MNIKLLNNQYDFHPGWKLSLFTLFFLPILLSLGFWQLDRAHQKKVLQQEYQKTSEAQIIPIQAISSSDKELDYTKVKLTGHYDNQHSFLVDNRTLNGRVGYEVITPFLVSNMNHAIFINRGWIAQGKTRDELPDIPSIDNTVSIEGRLYTPTKPSVFVPEMSFNSLEKWPIVIQYIDIEKMAKIIEKPKFSYVISLEENMPGALQRIWQPISLSPTKHIGYAVQWFGLALALIILYIVANTKKYHKLKTDKHE